MGAVPDGRLLLLAAGAEGLDDGTSMTVLLLRFLDDMAWVVACALVKRGSASGTEGIEVP